MILQVESVTKKFGGLSAVSEVSLEIEEGNIIGLIGPNGAGKTTLFNCINGTLPITEGKIVFDGVDITRKKSHEIAKLGIARSYQIVQPFGNMTTLQNAMVGGFCKTKVYKEAEAIALRSLELVRLDHKKDLIAKHLNLGERKKLEIAKALSTQPKLLLLDEVMAGLTPSEVQEMVKIIHSINASGITLIIIEHIMEAIMSLSKRIVVLNFGKKIMEGTPEEVSSNQQVIEAYFGVEDGEADA
ncbi:ABC transporter ATP-binding protein [Anoxybacterium hadale]|uniref:ABC transporter ATP-binding protein n=1 Tax=Anoxybacterium hadale TaxID=3408580 RepID=A0ACD1A8G3_9FIRM|nr:ABC transporter ATP-binding protein [Clostridiales bacterium]